jgi:hypothetical protein
MCTSLMDADVTVDAVSQVNLSRHEDVLLCREAVLGVLEKAVRQGNKVHVKILG